MTTTTTKTVLTKRGNFVVGFLIGATLSLTLNFFMTHHVVIDTNTCKQTDVGVACDYHYERNK